MYLNWVLLNSCVWNDSMHVCMYLVLLSCYWFASDTAQGWSQIIKATVVIMRVNAIAAKLVMLFPVNLIDCIEYVPKQSMFEGNKALSCKAHW